MVFNTLITKLKSLNKIADPSGTKTRFASPLRQRGEPAWPARLARWESVLLYTLILYPQKW